jgi:hypothetical protein
MNKLVIGGICGGAAIVIGAAGLVCRNIIDTSKKAKEAGLTPKEFRAAENERKAAKKLEKRFQTVIHPGILDALNRLKKTIPSSLPTLLRTQPLPYNRLKHLGKS